MLAVELTTISSWASAILTGCLSAFLTARSIISLFAFFICFLAIKSIAEIRRKIRPESAVALDNILCKYSLEDREYLRYLRKIMYHNYNVMPRLLSELGWAMGYTTRNPYETNPIIEPDGYDQITQHRKEFSFGVSKRDKRKRRLKNAQAKS